MFETELLGRFLGKLEEPKVQETVLLMKGKYLLHWVVCVENQHLQTGYVVLDEQRTASQKQKQT